MARNRQGAAFSVALGGVLAALAAVIMGVLTWIPVATFVCPMLCMLMLRVVCEQCGRRIGWAWYGAVCILSLLFSPDKEAAAVFLFLGYYPIVKPQMDRLPLPWLWKGLLFNISTAAMYVLLLQVFGLASLAAEYKRMGSVLLIISLILGNLTFFLLDRLLGMKGRKKHG